MSTQNVDVACFARNVKSDFSMIFKHRATGSTLELMPLAQRIFLGLVVEPIFEHCILRLCDVKTSPISQEEEDQIHEKEFMNQDYH